MGLSLAYLVTQMPVKSEVFLSIEVRKLAEAGATVRVFCLRNRQADYQKLVGEQELAAIEISYFPYLLAWQVWQDIRYWVKRKPRILWQLVWIVTQRCWHRPLLWLKSLLIIPKSFSVARAIEAVDIDIVHVAWGHYPAVTAYLLKQVLPELHITIALGAYDRLLRHPMTPLAVACADTIFTQSEASATLIRTEWPKPSVPVVPIMRGIDFAMIDTLPPVEKQVGLIVSAGRLVKEKGYQHLIAAFAKVHKAQPEARLVIWGEGPYRRALKRQIGKLGLSDVVELAGHLKQVEMFRRLAQAAVFVLASQADYDNLPNVIKEAMALGVPVITTPTLGIETLVQDGVTGFIVPKGDVAAIVQAIQAILGDTERRAQISENGWQRVRDLFDVKKTTRQRLEIYESLSRHAEPPDSVRE